MSSCHQTMISMKVPYTILIDQAGNDVMVNFTLSHRLVGELMYPVYKTRPNIAFVEGRLSQHNFDP